MRSILVSNNRKDKNNCKHDSIVNRLEDIVNRRLPDFKTYQLTSYPGGEIDLYAKKGDYVLLFEIKCNDSYKNYNHAVEQMQRAKRLFFGYRPRVFMFYAFQEKNSNHINYTWVKTI